MNISRKSWHYRLHVAVFTIFNTERYGLIKYVKGARWEHQPKTLCGYFWSTTLLTALTPVWLAVLVAVTPILALALGGEYVHGKYRQWRPKDGPGRLGIAAQYAAARKKKVCPLLTVVD